MTAIQADKPEDGIVGHRETSGLALRSFRVGAFRGLRDVELPDLARFNLLVGGNNSGKTSLLEAIAVYFAPVDMVAWADIARNRDVRMEAPWRSAESPIDSIRWLFPQAIEPGSEAHQPVHLATGNNQLHRQELYATCEPMRGIPPESAFDNRFDGRFDRHGPKQAERSLREDSGWLIRVRKTPHVGGFQVKGGEHDFPLWSRLGLRYGRAARRTGPAVFLLPPYAHRNEASNQYLMRTALIGDWKEEAVDLLGRIDPAIKGVEVVPSETGAAVLMIRHTHDGLVPVNILGDGIRRALSIALTIRAARGGIILIDEIEAALHVSALARFIPWFAQACIENDVQVIATTHSLEAIGTMTEAFSGDRANDLAAFHLSDRNDGTPPKRYSGAMLHRLVAERGLDIR